MGVGKGDRALLLLASVVIVAAGMKLAAPLLVPFFLATFISIVTSPLIVWVGKKGVPRLAGVTLAIVVDIAALAAMGGLVAGSLNSFYDRLPNYQDQLWLLIVDVSRWLSDHGVSLEPEQLSKILDPGAIVGLAGSMLRSAAGVLSNVLLVLVIVMFMMLEGVGLRKKLEHMFDMTGGNVDRLAHTTGEVQKYLVVKTGSSLATGLLVGLWVWTLGVDLPLVWALIAFVFNYVPAIGSLVAAIPPISVALLLQGPGTAAAVGIGYIVVNFSIGNFLEPRILGRALGLSPLVVFLSVLFWGWILGPIGALLSVPLTMVLKIVCANTEDFQWLSILLGPARDLDGSPGGLGGAAGPLEGAAQPLASSELEASSQS